MTQSNKISTVTPLPDNYWKIPRDIIGNSYTQGQRIRPGQSIRIDAGGGLCCRGSGPNQLNSRVNDLLTARRKPWSSEGRPGWSATARKVP